MKSKFNFSMMAAMFAILSVATFVACDKDDDTDSGAIADNTIVAAVNNGSSYSGQIDAVKAIVDADEEYDSETGTYVLTGYEAGSAPYVNGGFTLKLQATVADKYLGPMFDDEDEEIPGITISNPNVKVNSTIILAYKADVLTGLLYYRTADETWDGILLYANGDISITGSTTDDDGESTYIEKYNVHLKKGWNMIYGKEVEKESGYEYELTSTAPTGLQWYFYDSDNSKSQQATAGASLKKRLQAFGVTQ
ncbi:MAG: hypothetical protein LBS09_06070 [Bacteroidales bacterium]|jgi:hypothetical protein|nr:hypothetical protein [Bacteroidales bacterium]